MVIFCPKKHAGSRNPEDLQFVVVLTSIDFSDVHHSASAKGITHMVDEASGCPSIFKFGSTIVGHDFRPRGSNIWMSIHVVDDGLAPIFGHFNVGADENVILCLYLR